MRRPPALALGYEYLSDPRRPLRSGLATPRSSARYVIDGVDIRGTLYSAAWALSAATRSSVDGCVVKREVRPRRRPASPIGSPVISPVASNAYSLAADPTKTYVPPEAQDEVPFLNFAPLQDAITRLEVSAAAYDAAYDAMRVSHAASAAAPMADHRDVQQRLNAALIQTERLMTHEDGLPRRGWFRHQIYAPGFYTGYGVKTLPGIREAIEQRGWDEASEQVERLADTLTRLAGKIDEATALLRG